jgi:hypothetical protein
MSRSRREFLGDVGKGMLVASLGPGLAEALSISEARADDAPDALTFGSLEPLVGLMQDTPADRLLPALVDRMRTGTELRELVAAGALANARTFGGEDYVGFHAFMAMAPSWHMSKELPADRRALPVLKVLYRSCSQIQAKGGRKNEVLHEMDGAEMPSGSPAEHLRQATRAQDVNGAERAFAALVEKSPKSAFDTLQAIVHDDVDVHRVVLAYRAWAMLDLAGREHALTMLRQSVRYCVDVERKKARSKYPEPQVRTVLPRVLDKHRLLERAPGTRPVDDAWVDRMAVLLLTASPEDAADAVGAALAEGIDPQAVGEALTVSATEQVLRDPGRPQKWASPGKPEGSVHGDSIGVHASDSMNAWRNIAAVANRQNAMISLVAAAVHLTQSGKMATAKRYPWAEHLEAVRSEDPQALLKELDAAVRAKDQIRTSALVRRYGDLDHASRPVFDLLLRYATSEDGSLHAEKYYRTVKEEFGRGRKALRWRHVTALARVTASEFGQTAAGYEEACRLLKIQA